MRQVTELNEIQNLALNILIQVDQFCKENRINYYLAYGTLLGTIRHKGFIPWDDDIDIWMKRDDYRRMISLFPEWGEKHGLFLNATQTVPMRYNRVSAQICLQNTKLVPRELRICSDIAGNFEKAREQVSRDAQFLRSGHFGRTVWHK